MDIVRGCIKTRKYNMKNLYAIALIFCTLPVFVNAQQNSAKLDSLVQEFETFQYTRVIAIADSLLNTNSNFSDNQLIDIYRIKGISEFSLQDEGQAQISFRAILNIDTTFNLDSSKTSPKIISFFNNVKSKYLTSLSKEKELRLARQDSLKSSQINLEESAEENLRKAMIRSLILPGLGHFYMGEKSKGIILTSFSTISLGSMIYFIIDANKKENEYRSETDPNLRPVRYTDFHNSTKLRNFSIITFAAIWIYSQIDILFFTKFQKESDLNAQKLPTLNYNSFRGIQLSYKFSF